MPTHTQAHFYTTNGMNVTGREREREREAVCVYKRKGKADLYHTYAFIYALFA